MYEGTNPKALQSRQWIIEALISSMKEVPYSQITIKDICKRADLSRQTFYNIFDSKDDILRAYLKTEVGKVYRELSEMSAVRTLGLDDMMHAFAEVLDSSRDVLAVMEEQGLGYMITDEISGTIALFSSRFTTEEIMQTDPNDRVYSQAFLTGGLTNALVRWLEQDDPIDVDLLCEIIKRILRGGLAGSQT